MLSIRRFFNSMRRETGQSLVEMALILPILLILLFGVIEFSRVLGSYLLVSHCSREGARLAAVGGTNSEINARVNEMAVLLDPDELTVDISPSGTRPRGSSVTVTLNYSVDIFLPLPAGVVPDPFPIEAATTMRVE